MEKNADLLAGSKGIYCIPLCYGGAQKKQTLLYQASCTQIVRGSKYEWCKTLSVFPCPGSYRCCVRPVLQVNRCTWLYSCKHQCSAVLFTYTCEYHTFSEHFRLKCSAWLSADLITFRNNNRKLSWLLMFPSWYAALVFFSYSNLHWIKQEYWAKHSYPWSALLCHCQKAIGPTRMPSFTIHGNRNYGQI